MERRKSGIKVENTKNNINLGSSFYPDHVQISTSTTSTSFPLQGPFEYSLSDQVVDGGGGNNSSLGFMELLGLQDYGNYNNNNNNPSSILDMVQAPYTRVQLKGGPPPLSSPPCTSSTLVSNTNNQPGTPISSSISSASSEALNDETLAKGSGGDEEEEGGGGDEQEDHNKTKKGLRPKKSNQKKQKEHRVAFMTKSEVDHLEDGYRWRKYGQKAVKNSPFPRSYYRCTTASCNVKKRVERSFTDPSIVVTTYEGQHNHHGPIMARPAFAGPSAYRCYPTAGAFGMPMQTRAPLHHQQQHFLNPHNSGYNTSAGIDRHLHEKLLCTPQGSSLLKDHGLLQDLLPCPMFKEESEGKIAEELLLTRRQQFSPHKSTSFLGRNPGFTY